MIPGLSTAFRLCKSPVARWLRHLREKLATGQAPFNLAILGLLAGFLAGALVLLFRLALEWCAESVYPSLKVNAATHLTLLPMWFFFLAPTIGGLIVGLGMSFIKRQHRQVGLSHVVLYVHQHDAKLPWQNAVAQVLGSLGCFLSGQSVGREGPAVHLGVAINSLFGQWLRLPHNTLRILAGCGTAAAIAASFNTPIAGVIFAMEVVLVEYTIAGFTPVMLAAVVGTALVRMVYGDAPFILVPQILAPGLWDLGFVLLLGVVISMASASFVTIQRYCLRFSVRPIWLRLGIAGMVTGSLAMLEPGVLGSGFFTIEELLSHSQFATTLAVIILTKLLATAVSIGLGMPGGLISPTMYIGACIGALTGYIINIVAPELSGSIALYTLLGMAAMMGAVLNAPLAALMALMELTYSPNIIFPGMLVIVTANICHRELFAQPAAIDASLEHDGFNLRHDPVRQFLQRKGVSSLMSTDIQSADAVMSIDQIQVLLEQESEWIITHHQEQDYLVDRQALAELVRRNEFDNEQTFDLITLKLTNQIATIDSTANLHEAWRTLLRTGSEAVCVRSKHAYLLHSNLGIITRKALEAYLYQVYGATH
jgi:CIC family chloride channel protein